MRNKIFIWYLDICNILSKFIYKKYLLYKVFIFKVILDMTFNGLIIFFKDLFIFRL